MAAAKRTKKWRSGLIRARPLGWARGNSVRDRFRARQRDTQSTPYQGGGGELASPRASGCGGVDLSPICHLILQKPH